MANIFDLGSAREHYCIIPVRFIVILNKDKTFSPEILS